VVDDQGVVAVNEPRCTALRTVAAAAAVAGLLLNNASLAHAVEPGWELESMSVPQAWAESKGAGVTIAVVDSGIRVDHEALAGRAEEAPDLLEETDQGEPYYGLHGTAMASHVLDVAPEARVLGLRALRDEGDPDYENEPVPQTDEPARDHITAGILDAVDAGAGVISLSLGTAQFQLLTFSAGQASAIKYAASKGVIVVAAAGNEADDTNDISYPANYPGVLAVGAADSSGEHSEFSNVHSYVDLLAPGEDVSAADAVSGGRERIDGTSSATAYAAGVAALLKSAYPDLAPRQIEQVLHRTASSYEQGHDPVSGYGLIDAAAAPEEAKTLDPLPALVPPVEHSGPSHLGPADDGTPPGVGQGLDSEYLMVSGVAAAIALVLIGPGALLYRSGRRAGGPSRAEPEGAGAAPAR
jgi:subtilisin family serine protease